MLHRQQLRRGGIVVIPQIVMHDLEVPNPLSRSRVERQQTVAKEIIALPIAAIQIVRGRAGRQKYDAVLLVEREIAPRVRATRVPESILWHVSYPYSPGRGICERPHELAADHVVGAYSPGGDPYPSPTLERR